MTMDI